MPLLSPVCETFLSGLTLEPLITASLPFYIYASVIKAPLTFTEKCESLYSADNEHD